TLCGSGVRRCCMGRPRAEGADQPRTVEAQAVAGEELREMRPLVRPRARDGLDAVAQHAVPVAVVAAEAGEVLAQLAERLAQIAGRRIVGLEAREDLAATEEVG